VVCVLALAIGMLLNAPGAHKSAYNKSDGWQRDVALALTGPLAGVSHALLLDRPRKGVQALTGRSGEDEIHTEIALPVTPAPTTPSSKPRTGRPSSAKPPAKEAFSPRRKLTIWIAGDSLVITPGYAIIRAAGASPAMQSVGGVDGRIATGLTRPDVFNWFDEIRKQVKEQKPKVVVLDFVNAVVEKQARKRPGRAAYIDTYRLFAGDDGGYTQYMRNLSGDLVQVRAADGVHFEREGGDIIAREVLKALNKQFDLTSWRKKTR
jgi:hypothetical protein